MAISYQCPACKFEGEAPDDLAGRRVRCPRCRELIVLAKAEESVVAKPPGEEVVAAAQSVDTQDWRPAVDEILSLMQKSSDRRDELLGLIDNKLFAISFCVFLWTIALVLGGCVFIVKQ